MKVLDEAHFGKAVNNILSKAEITLKEDSRIGTVLDYGSNIKEYIHSVDVSYTKVPIALGGSRYMYYDYYNYMLPDNVNPVSVLAVSCNMEGDDVLINKVATMKHVGGRTFRIDFSGNAHTNTLASGQKRCRLQFRIMMLVGV